MQLKTIYKLKIEDYTVQQLLLTTGMIKMTLTQLYKSKDLAACVDPCLQSTKLLQVIMIRRLSVLKVSTKMTSTILIKAPLISLI